MFKWGFSAHNVVPARDPLTSLVLIFVLAVALAPHVDERPIQPGAHGYTNMLINSVDKAGGHL